jgi:hypothetical protein
LLLHISGKNLPRIEEFGDELIDLMAENEISLDEVWNMDQVGVMFELVPDKIVAPSGDKNIQVKKAGKDKIRATVIFLVGYSLDLTPKKSKPFVIFKGKPEGRLAAEYTRYNNDMNSPCYVVFQDNAWTDGQNIQVWAEKIYWPTVES